MSQGPTADEWNGVVLFYKDLIERCRWAQEPMLAFALWLGGSEFATSVFPSLSHEALGLSLVRFYKERLHRPMVYVRYVAATPTFKLIFQIGQGSPHHEKDVSDPRPFMNEIESWLRDG